MAWEEIVRSSGANGHSQEWVRTPCVTLRKTGMVLNGAFQRLFGVTAGTAAIVRWDDERRVVGLEIGPVNSCPSGFRIHICGGKNNQVSASITCTSFLRRLTPYLNCSYRAVKRDETNIIEIALLPANEVK
jgi:hypothetical protein